MENLKKVILQILINFLKNKILYYLKMVINLINNNYH
jgi:hypothetical protein